MKINAWRIFENTGKVSDYLAYKADESQDTTDSFETAEAFNNADKNQRDCAQATQYR